MYNNVLSGKHGRCIYGDVLVSTGMWNEDKRAVAVIHDKSTRLQRNAKTNNNFALAA